MRVTVVGSGDAFGSGGRFQTCIALGSDGAAAASHTLIDCGATSAVALKQQGFDLNSVETVLVTHLHADHFGGHFVPGPRRPTPVPYGQFDGGKGRRGTERRVQGERPARRIAAASVRAREGARVRTDRSHFQYVVPGP